MRDLDNGLGLVFLCGLALKRQRDGVCGFVFNSESIPLCLRGLYPLINIMCLIVSSMFAGSALSLVTHSQALRTQ